MARAGYNTAVRMTGTATVMTDAATTELDPLDGTVFQVTNDLHRVLSPDHSVSVSDNGTPLVAGLYSVDYLFGIVTLAFPATGPVTITARFLPLYKVAECRSAEVNETAAELDTSIQEESHTSIITGKLSATVSIEGLRLAAETIDDAGTIVETVRDIFNDRLPKLVEVEWGTVKFRMWGVLPSHTQSSAQDGVISGAREFRSIVRPAFGRSEAVSFGDGT